MANIGETVTGLIPSGSIIGLIMLLIIFGIATLAVIGIIGLLIWNKKRWNLKVEIKLPRSNGKIINGEWGKGYFHSKQGVVYIRRPGFMQPKIPLKIFDPKRYLQGTDLLTVIQLSPLDYRPVRPESFLEYDIEYTCEKDYADNKSFFDNIKFGKKYSEEDIQSLKKGDVVIVKESVMNLECDTGASKAWQVSFEAAAKKAYSLQSFFSQFQTPIAIAIVLIAVFVGFAALWTQLPGS